jgi:hypothetical protein
LLAHTLKIQTATPLAMRRSESQPGKSSGQFRRRSISARMQVITHPDVTKATRVKAVLPMTHFDFAAPQQVYNISNSPIGSLEPL